MEETIPLKKKALEGIQPVAINDNVQDIHPVGPNPSTLLDNPNVTLKTTTTLNQTTLLLDSEGDSVLQNNFLDQPLSALDWELYIAGSSFMENGR